MHNWYQSAIQRGDQTGSKHVYPTINLDPSVLPSDTQRGVWASRVKWGKAVYQGALYFGPRVVKGETNDVLEIYLLDFTGHTADKTVEFTLAKFLRGVMDFPDLTNLRQQVTKDIKNVRKVFDEK
ncbi:MAG: Riboflavin biosynthesis protein RibF [Candidatus Pacebacteria bacterium GW2011_GWB1_47_8]|nr:MAG: Riboflavin biosynthesis protein RibF [Candidatus Pacebacteria bacterium GW2011_GWA1_46_10]KKU84258.1 MAG: Riboflavin biosynthesis protein RibF [Candidatus Pacebacteria bacterium GW2011_GWB1_47_8]HCR81478.1 hypothetical protein [Candidatus Paceibacterota bacterium]